MASSGLDFSKLTPSNKAVDSLRELIFLALADVETLGSIINFVPDQEHGKKVGFIGEYGLLGSASQGCDPEYGSSLAPTAEKVWDIHEWEIAESICYADLKSTLARTALRTKTSVADLTGTEYMDEILMPLLERAVKKLVLRFAFFGDKDATTYDAVSQTDGTLKEGVAAKYFNLIDGFWKQIFTGVTAGKITRVTVSANAQNTAAAQKSAILTAGAASGVMDDLIMSASTVLRQQGDAVRIYVSQAFADALSIDLKKNNKGSDLQWEALFDGISKSTYNGVEVIALPFWDEIINAYLRNTTNPTAVDKPYRAIMTIKDNLMVGSESESEVADIQVFFEKKDQKNYILAKDTIGALIAQENLMVVAY